MTTIRATLYRDREKKNGGYSLVIRVTHKRSYRMIYTPYVLTNEEFDDKSQKAILSNNKKFTRKQIAEINQYTTQIIDQLKTITERLTARNKDFNVQNIIDEYQCDKSNQHLIIFTERLIEKRIKADKMGQAKALQSTLSSLKKFIGDRDVLFNDITHLFIHEYENYLLDTGVQENTVGYYMRNVRIIYNTALNCGVYMDDNHPFSKIRIRHGRTAKRALKKEVIEQIATLDLSKNPTLESARDLFMFSFYTRGMSFVDIIYLKHKDIIDGVIYYQRHKTHRQMRVAIVPQLQTIIEKYRSEDEYVLPFINANDYSTIYKRYLIAYGNIYRNLKRLQKMLNIPTSLTVHVARHSWATIAKSKGASIEAIRQGLGHDSEKTTEIYLKELDNSVIDAVNEKVSHFYH